MEMKSIDIPFLRSILSYDPISGILTWKKHRWKRMVGKKAGTKTYLGYLTVQIDRKIFLVHRLAWAIHHGEWPVQIDHINGEKEDNRLSNLRNCSSKENSQNRRTVLSKVGVLGVCKSGSGFKASIGVNRKSKYLGTFKTVELAHNAYLSAKAELHNAPTQQAGLVSSPIPGTP